MNRYRLTLGFIIGLSALAFLEESTRAQEKEKPSTLLEYRTKMREELLKKYGGDEDSEAAVVRGLIWLAGEQKKDGSWAFDGTNKDQIAATAMTLLPFLAAGETQTGKGVHKDVVKKGLNFLIGKQKTDGSFTGAQTTYTHAFATLTLCDAYALTKDANLKSKAQSAINYIGKQQGKNGSWGYTPGTEGDTSIVGWQLQALLMAKKTDLKVSDSTIEKARDFLISVSTEKQSRYGYSSPGGHYYLDRGCGAGAFPDRLDCRNSGKGIGAGIHRNG